MDIAMKLLTTFLLLLLSFAASAAEEKYVISGAGTISCGKFLESQKNVSLKNMQISWAQGFLSGMNLADTDTGKDMLPLPDGESVNLYLVNYCTQNPLESPAFGAVFLYKELRSRTQRAP